MRQCIIRAARGESARGQEESREGVNEGAMRAAEETTRSYFTLREEIKVGRRASGDGEGDSCEKEINEYDA